MHTKKWFLSLIALLVLAFTAFGGLMYWMDPVLHYGKENPLFSYYEYSELYTNPGIALHYDYDAVMVGTSMIENTDVDLCEELWDCRMVRLPYSGGTTFNMKTILDLCFESGNQINTVYWELDEFQLTGSATKPRYPLPDYLYRTDHKDDLSYLLNLDIFYHYGVNNLLGTLRGEVQPAARRGETLTGNYGKEALLSAYHRPVQAAHIYLFEGSALQESVNSNLQNIESLLQAHPETEFVFFLPPFSVLYWDRELANGKFDAILDCVEYACAQLLPYPNVQIHFYQNEEAIITDLDNYKDYSHYGPWINDLLTQLIADGKNLMTSSNYIQQVEGLRAFIHQFDFQALYPQP